MGREDVITKRLKVVVSIMLMLAVAMVLVPAAALAQEDEVDITKQDETGTDPRGFGTKFMPYYW